MQNLTRLTTDEACDRDNGNCKYYMELCFSFAKSLDCSFLDHPSLTWAIKPGESKILSIGDPVFQCYSNPLRFRLRTWKAVGCDSDWSGLITMYFQEEKFN